MPCDWKISQQSNNAQDRLLFNLFTHTKAEQKRGKHGKEKTMRVLILRCMDTRKLVTFVFNIDNLCFWTRLGKKLNKAFIQ